MPLAGLKVASRLRTLPHIIISTALKQSSTSIHPRQPVLCSAWRAAAQQQGLQSPPYPSASTRTSSTSTSSTSSTCGTRPSHWWKPQLRSQARAPHICVLQASRGLVTSSMASSMSALTAEPGTGKGTRIAVAQMTSIGDQQANLAVNTKLAQEAAAAGARMLFLPENFSFIGMQQGEALKIAQPLDGPLMQQYQQLARSTGLWLSLGGFQECGPDASHTYNTHVVISDAGNIAAVYRKIHLFDVDVPNGPVLMESRATAPGDKLVVCDSPAGRLGLTICYDLRFPELYQKLTWGLGAQVLTVPSAFTKVTGAAHWEILLRARAIECQAWVIAAAQAGRHNDKRESYGHSLVIDPWGRVAAKLDDPLATGIAVADIDLATLQEVRTKMPIEDHRAKGHAAYFP